MEPHRGCFRVPFCKELQSQGGSFQVPSLLCVLDVYRAPCPKSMYGLFAELVLSFLELPFNMKGGPGFKRNTGRDAWQCRSAAVALKKKAVVKESRYEGDSLISASQGASVRAGSADLR